MQLSKHFTLEEMTKSMTAKRKGIDNTPGAGEIKSLDLTNYFSTRPFHFGESVGVFFSVKS